MITSLSYDFRMRRMLHSYDSLFRIWFIDKLMVFISEKLRINWLLFFCELRVKGCSHKSQPVIVLLICGVWSTGVFWWAVLDRGFWWCFYCCYCWERGCSSDGRVGRWCIYWWSVCHSVVGLRVSLVIYKEFVHCWNRSSQQLLLPPLQPFLTTSPRFSLSY